MQEAESMAGKGNVSYHSLQGAWKKAELNREIVAGDLEKEI